MFATKTRLIAAATLACSLAAGAAHASDVSWSIGIQAPIGPGANIGTVISNRYVAPVVVSAPVIVPAPVVYAPPPPPVIVAPRPVVLPAPVVYAPPVYAPRRVVMAPVWVHGRWVYPSGHDRRHHHGWRDERGHWDDDHRGPPAYEPRRGHR